MSAYTTHPIELPRSWHPFDQRVASDMQSHREDKSVVFDADWYRRAYPDWSISKTPLEHYLDLGWRLGNDPNPFFSTEYYLAAYPDVAGAHINPFLHYVLYGVKQGRRPRSEG